MNSRYGNLAAPATRKRVHPTHPLCRHIPHDPVFQLNQGGGGFVIVSHAGYRTRIGEPRGAPKTGQ
jgi:hypothetical protein